MRFRVLFRQPGPWSASGSLKRLSPICSTHGVMADWVSRCSSDAHFGRLDFVYQPILKYQYCPCSSTAPSIWKWPELHYIQDARTLAAGARLTGHHAHYPADMSSTDLDTLLIRIWMSPSNPSNCARSCKDSVSTRFHRIRTLDTISGLQNILMISP